MKFAASILALTVLLSPAVALAAPVSMDDMVNRALAQAPAMVAAQGSVAAQEARVGVARAGFLPQATLTAGSAQTTSASPSQTTAVPFNLSNLTVGGRQVLYTFGKVGANVDQAEANADAARASARQTAVDVAYGARVAYLNWTQAAGLEGYIAEQLRFAQATLAEARARYKTGVAAKLEVTRAETTVARAEAATAVARSQTAQARRSLAAAIGQTAPVEGSPVFPAEPAIAKAALPALEDAALQHPSVRNFEALVAQAAAASRASEVAGLPDLTADASYGLRARDFQGAQNWQAGINLNWPLFTGFAVTHQAEASRAQETSARANLDSRKLEILRDVDNAFLALAGARDTLPSVRAAVASARANLEQAQGRYRAGVGSIIEVADAQQLLASAQGDLVRATTAFHLAVADLQRAIGLTGVPSHDR